MGVRRTLTFLSLLLVGLAPAAAADDCLVAFAAQVQQDVGELHDSYPYCERPLSDPPKDCYCPWPPPAHIITLCFDDL